jgi:hypothetical protein
MNEQSFQSSIPLASKPHIDILRQDRAFIQKILFGTCEFFSCFSDFSVDFKIGVLQNLRDLPFLSRLQRLTPLAYSSYLQILGVLANLRVLRKASCPWDDGVSVRRKSMHRSKLAMVATIAALAIGGVGLSKCEAQQTGTVYGGYSSAQTSPQTSPQTATPCQPGPVACQNVQYGCFVTVCNCPCMGTDACDRIKKQIPDIHVPPACQGVPVCEIIDEGPPTAQPVTIPIYRNCYVPIKIVTKPGPGPGVITPVNIQVNWREVHILCDAKGVPLPSNQAAQILKELNDSLAKGGTPSQGAADQAPAAPAPVNSSQAPVQSQPTAPAAPATLQATAPAPAAAPTMVAQATDTRKQWVWLSQEGVYGYGYQRTDGYWEIDPDSRRATLQ